MSIKFDGMSISDAQISRIKKVSSDVEINSIRKKILKRKGLALASDNMISILIVRTTVNKKLKIDQKSQLLSLEFNSLFSDLIERLIIVSGTRLTISDFV